MLIAALELMSKALTVFAGISSIFVWDRLNLAGKETFFIIKV
ncbi:hypothetical protein COO91_04027 [Nostoc flagelliforme CCNUN1]|uniref:Uncharacterized protein n=1 Tax=Nostoc flagelliforme CCNUN1 TaxID=2038116 RepID=A0A2K8SRP5_9NOSO|nr:hypothetical protein COO91_04027 [Nostoc flagelliforme CCNUN1]